MKFGGPRQGRSRLIEGVVLGALLAGVVAQQTYAENGARIDLPPLAVVEQSNGTNGGWRITGRLSGGVAVAQQDFAVVLARQGWRLDKRIPLGNSTRRTELCLWKKKGSVILLMVWELEAGLSGFSIGWEDAAGAGPVRSPLAPTRRYN